MKTENFNTWFEVQKVTNKNYSKEQFDSMKDILEECWDYSKESVKENNINIDDCEYDDVKEMQDRIDELESALEEIHSLSNMVRIWHVRQYEPHTLISFKYKENAELWINMHQKEYNVKLDLVSEDIDESDLPPWSWILTMDFERERKGILTNWDSETEGYKD